MCEFPCKVEKNFKKKYFFYFFRTWSCKITFFIFSGPGPKKPVPKPVPETFYQSIHRLVPKLVPGFIFLIREHFFQSGLVFSIRERFFQSGYFFDQSVY